MATSNEIKNIATNVRDAKNHVSSKNNAYDKAASSLSLSWKGEAGKAFKDKSKRIKLPVKSVISGFSELNTKLIALSNSVRRAENENQKKETNCR